MLIHKFHLALGPGQQLVLADSGHPLFICQGHWDSGGALHCVAVAFALLGRLTEPVTLSRSDTGPEATFWDHAWPHYPHGLTPSELESFIWELSLGVRPVALHGSGVQRSASANANSRAAPPSSSAGVAASFAMHAPRLLSASRVGSTGKPSNPPPYCCSIRLEPNQSSLPATRDWSSVVSAPRM